MIVRQDTKKTEDVFLLVLFGGCFEWCVCVCVNIKGANLVSLLTDLSHIFLSLQGLERAFG